MRRKNWICVILITTLTAILFLASFEQSPPLRSNKSIKNDETSIAVSKIESKAQTDVDARRAYSIDIPNFFTENADQHSLQYDTLSANAEVSAKEDVKVIPGGQSIGVQLHTTGVLVVGHHLVKGEEGESSPGELANVEVGDIILKINDQSIQNMEDVKPLVKLAGESGEPLQLTIQRGEDTLVMTLNPVLDHRDKQYRLGLYIRDSAAGIGTLSFYEPKSKKYGALGHVISDMDTKKPIDIRKGTIVGSSVTNIQKGNNGFPGEKQAEFSINENKLGSITKNSPFGIFGTLTDPLKNSKYNQPMSVSLPHEVQEGPAKILTVIEGEKVEEFDVEIVSTTPQKKSAIKGMVIQITDPTLLERTGGIVQGMSGSPIIQNDKVIGAVTHVFVNDPTSGYGVHIEWMLQEIGVHLKKEYKQAS